MSNEATSLPVPEAAMSKKRRPSMQGGPEASMSTTGPTIRRMSRLEQRMSFAAANRRMSHVSRLSSVSGVSIGIAGFKHQNKIANTYRMQPEKEERFNAAAAEKLIKSVLTRYLDGEKYDKMLCTSLSKNLSDVIKDRIKDQGFSPRYKYVCLVTMGQVKEQGMNIASRCLWSTETDNYASATFTKGDLFAVATLYALYFE